MYCIETKNLSYRFSETEAIISNINLQVPQGSVYGFLGPNGAGKTTTLRLILGLLKKQEGEINVFNKPFAKNRIDSLRRIGSLIESPSLYGHLTAVENLRILQKVYRCPAARISQVLDMTGLSGTGAKRTASFSLGMKQRLGIAMALLHGPGLLILDEPTNGLDPNGIIEIRELLKQLNREQGLTIVISSHLLAEIEKMVTYLGIIHKGSLLFQGTLHDIRQAQALNTAVHFETNDPERAGKILLSNGYEPAYTNGMISIAATGKQTIAHLNQQLVNSGIGVSRISSPDNDLESLFIDLIKNK